MSGGGPPELWVWFDAAGAGMTVAIGGMDAAAVAKARHSIAMAAETIADTLSTSEDAGPRP